MTATKKQRTPEQKSKDAENARARRAAKKAQATGSMTPAPHLIDGQWQTVDVDGKTVKVAAALTPEEAVATARKLLNAPVEVKAAAEAEKPQKPARKAAAKTPRADKTHQRIYLSERQYERIAGDKDWQQANKSAWQAVKAGTRVEQKAPDGSIRKTYYSILIGIGAAPAVTAKLAAK